MPQSASPWRVLEEPPLPGLPGASPDPASSAAMTVDVALHASRPPEAGQPTLSAGGWRAAIARPSPWLIAVLVAAALLMVIAFLLAAASQQGLVEVGAASGSLRPAGSGGPGSAFPAGASTSPDVVVIEVAGAVLRPGLYTLPRGSRAGDAITAAGGYGPRVDAELASRSLNLATVLRDGERVRVPSRDDAPDSVAAPGGAAGATDRGGTVGSGSNGLLDLNGATAAALEALPGIGAATATKIIAARTERPFAAVDDLLERKLVSSKVLDAIRGLVTVR
jgi:competence protein ComEA